jgi:hypothetical protein
MITDHVVMPARRTDLNNASSDPLSSPALLRRLFYDYEKQSGYSFQDYHLSDLARNPSLPFDVFTGLLLTLKDVEEKFPLMMAMSAGMLSNFFFNPLTTFEQVLYIVCNSAYVKNIVDGSKVRSSRTVVEIFDRLVPLADYNHKVFLTRLLCSPFVSDEDFQLRIADVNVRPKLHEWTICSSVRFVPSDADYRDALVSLVSVRPDEFDHGLSILANPNSSIEFLTNVISYTAGEESAEAWVYENLNCPIELSAHAILENLDEYRWRPSALLTLNLKANEYLTLISGVDQWEELPLSWKLKMITM